WRPLHNDAAEDWAELKQQGKSAFESGDFAEANNLYDLAIRKHPQLAKVAALLCNSSATLLELQRFVEALSSASVAALLATEEALASKAWIRRGRALEGLKDKLAMKALDSVPLRLVQAEAGLLRKRFLAAQVAPVSELTTAEQLKRRDGGGCKTMDMNTGKSGSNDLSEPPLRAGQVGPSFIHPPAALP
ncbi:unnamed protein product, partial [Effrenium voratum]